jgi:hypothetical protein
MTQLIENAKVEPDKIMSSGSRYLKQQVIYYGEQRVLTFDTYNRTNYTPTGQEKVMVISKGLEFRPDLVSFDVYGYVDNWWRILEANKMKDIWEFKAGRTIILPDRVL